ncbi:hypothetical protein [Halomarina pelagica]|uniref:hypothetical protein n=1 Tax=Halomarina pelagica TaxID=2961599 RepID=UPI0020C2F93F|nr:hypothetical protein [Halomarina sp. BND7]
MTSVENVTEFVVGDPCGFYILEFWRHTVVVFIGTVNNPTDIAVVPDIADESHPVMAFIEIIVVKNHHGICIVHQRRFVAL